jgi:putative nucleotidyltransferase with HDIG domain
MRKIAVWALSPGMIIGRAIFDSRGFLLLNKGVKLKMKYIQNLKRMQIPAVYIVDKLISDVEIEDLILDETRQKAHFLIRDILKGIQEQPEKSIPKLIHYQKDLGHILEDIIGQLLENRNFVVNLTDIRTSDSYTFAHSVNVAILAVMIAISMGFSRSELKKIAFGAILHDLGKAQMPSSILHKNGKLLPEEYEEMKKHPFYGYNLIHARDFVASSSARIIYEHHERMDGSGYPEGLEGAQIHPFSKICAVADVYDALVSDRPYQPAFLPHEALEILESDGEKFDATVIEKFCRHIAAYPIGTLVGLSNGEVGIVVHNTVGFPFSPKVRSICLKQNLEQIIPYEVDLIKNKNIVVDKVYRHEELPAKTFFRS